MIHADPIPSNDIVHVGGSARKAAAASIHTRNLEVTYAVGGVYIQALKRTSLTIGQRCFASRKIPPRARRHCAFRFGHLVLKS